MRNAWLGIPFGFAALGMLGALWTVWILVFVASAATVAVALSAWGPARLAGISTHRARLERKERRDNLLEAGAAPAASLDMVTALVDQIALTGGEATVARRSLLDMLDVYAELVVARTGYERVFHAADRTALVKAMNSLSRADDPASVARRRCLQKRIEHWDGCFAAAARCTAEMAAITEYLHLVSERTITDAILVPEHDLAQRLDEVDHEAAALRELAAG